MNKSTTKRPSTSTKRTVKTDRSSKQPAKRKQRSGFTKTGETARSSSDVDKGLASSAPLAVERILNPHEEWIEYRMRQKELKTKIDAASKTLEAWLATYHKRRDYANICGASVKLRTKFGHAVSPLEVVIAINVREKLSLEKCKSRRFKVLDHIGDFRVKVLEGHFTHIPGSNALYMRGSHGAQHQLPFSAALVGGIPIANPNNHFAFGTLGLIHSDGSTQFGLTCKHVVDSGFQVDQLGMVGSLPVGRGIGHVGRTLGSPSPNHTLNGRSESLDCAVVELVSGSGVVLPPTGSWIRGLTHQLDSEPAAGQTIPMYYSKRPILGRDKGAKIWKFGVGSGTITIGRLDTTNHATLDVGGIAYTKNFTVHPYHNRNGSFVVPGDSGSILAIEALVDGNPAFVAIGVLFATLASNMSVGLACNINHVMDALRLPIPKRLLRSNWELP